MEQNSKVPIFISSPHYGLEDLRGELFDFLSDFGTNPQLSSENGFPDHHGYKPYAQCLQVIESSLMVIGIIDYRYGTKMNDWGKKHIEFKGLSPTHAELRHTLNLKKRLLIFVREDIASYYDIYRINKNNLKNLNLPDRLDIDTLKMYEEMKKAENTPWIESFKDVRDIKKSIKQRLLSDLHKAIIDRDKINLSNSELLLEKVLELSPEIRDKLEEALADRDPKLTKYFNMIDKKQEPNIEPNSFINGAETIFKIIKTAIQVIEVLSETKKKQNNKIVLIDNESITKHRKKNK